MPKKRTFTFLAVISVLLAVFVGARGQTHNARSGILTARQIAKKTLPSVVVLFTERAGRSTVSIGTGFFIDTNVIATNYHVVQNATRISAKLIIQKQTFNISELIGVDKERDFALLRVDGLRLRPLPLGNTKHLAIGDEVYVVGNPEGWEGTFSQGIISGFRRDSYIQITAPISHGSSGGPVLNNLGEVIGMATAVVREGQNLNFAISSSALGAFHKRVMRNYIPVVRAGVPPGVQPGSLPSFDEFLISESLISRGNQYYRRKIYAKAVQEYKAAIRHSPDSPDAYYRLGNSYLRMSRNLDAMTAYKTAIAFGKVYHSIPDDNEAIQAYQILFGANPRSDIATLLLGEAHLKKCENKSALQKYVALRNLKSTYADLLHQDIELHSCELDLTGVDELLRKRPK